jgi:TonB-dependent SusC/RagA subfamily outer membrane receptor
MKETRRTLLVIGLALWGTFSAWAIDLNVKNVTVEEAVSVLNRIAKVSIVVNPEGIDLQKIVSVDVKGAEVADVLDRIFAGQYVTYDIKQDRIIIRHAQHSVSEDKVQVSQVSGRVHDSANVPVPGAVVLNPATGEVSITDVDGKFSISAGIGTSLTISCLGFNDKTFSVSGENMDVALDVDSQLLEEVVVVGYGTQKKVNLTGSIASVDVSEMTESRPITNLSNALAGVAAGVSVTSSANKSGSDNASILVRGQGTLNSSAPLVIIDGVESSYNSVNPQDVASISILKDAASAAIYGSRAANGVILITTKEGKPDQFTLDYHGYVSIQSSRKAMELVSNYADYMEYANEAYTNSALPAPFSQDSITQ